MNWFSFSSQKKRTMSHWDWLPPEIQEYIISLAEAQYIRDNRRNKLRNELHKEILLYSEVKEACGRGSITFGKGQCRQFTYSNGQMIILKKETFIIIYGSYIDSNNVKRRHQLASRSLEFALRYIKRCFREHILHQFEKIYFCHRTLFGALTRMPVMMTMTNG